MRYWKCLATDRFKLGSTPGTYMWTFEKKAMLNFIQEETRCVSYTAKQQAHCIRWRSHFAKLCHALLHHLLWNDRLGS